jgi:hypothetical protein
MIRSPWQVPAVLKGDTHCGQRVFAALLHLQCKVPITTLDTLFSLKLINDLGEDTDAVELNRCLRSAPLIEWLAKNYKRAMAQLLPPVVGDTAVRNLLRNLKENEAVYTFPVDYRGVGRHCSLAFKPAEKSAVIIWDPSPTFDNDTECPIWTRHNETCLNFRAYAEARLVQWTPLPAQQSRKNRKRKRKRGMGKPQETT